MNRYAAIFLLLSCGAFCAKAQGITKLFIVAGQSNAYGLGQASDLTPEMRAPQTDILYNYDIDNLESLTRLIPLAPLNGLFGPELELGRILNSHLSDELAIVKIAFGGTPLAMSDGRDWNPNSNNELYDRLIFDVALTVRVLQHRGKQVELGSIFWVQGERDSRTGNLAGGNPPLPQPETANSYQDNLTAFIEGVRTDLKAPDLPFFIGKIKVGDNPTITTVPDSNYNTRFGEYGLTPTVQAAQDEVARSLPNVLAIDSTHFSLKDDYLHFDSQGQIQMGAAFANSYLEYLQSIPEPASTSLFLIGLTASLLCLQRKR